MAKIVLTDAFFSIGGTDLSDHVRQITINYSADGVENTAMGDSTHTRQGGLKDWSASVEFYNDEAASSVAATIFPLVGTTATIIGRPTSGAVSATNPNYTGTGLVTSFPPLSGSVGEMSMTTCEIEAAGDLSRATS